MSNLHKKKYLSKFKVTFILLTILSASSITTIRVSGKMFKKASSTIPSVSTTSSSSNIQFRNSSINNIPRRPNGSSAGKNSCFRCLLSFFRLERNSNNNSSDYNEYFENNSNLPFVKLSSLSAEELDYILERNKHQNKIPKVIYNNNSHSNLKSILKKPKDPNNQNNDTDGENSNPVKGKLKLVRFKLN